MKPKLEWLLEFCGKWHCSCFARFWQDCNQLLSLKSFPSLVINWALPVAGCPLESVKHSSERKSPQYLFIPLMALKAIAKSPDLTLQLDKHIKETMLVFPGISRAFQYTFLISSALCRYIWNILPNLYLVLSWKIIQVDSLLEACSTEPAFHMKEYTQCFCVKIKELIVNFQNNFLWIHFSVTPSHHVPKAAEVSEREWLFFLGSGS